MSYDVGEVTENLENELHDWYKILVLQGLCILLTFNLKMHLY